MFVSRVIRASGRVKPARLTASTSALSALRVSIAKRAMGGSAGGHADHGHGHGPSGGIPTPRIRTEEDKYPFSAGFQESYIGEPVSRDVYWSRVLRQMQRPNPYPYDDPRSTSWLKDIPFTTSGGPMPQGASSKLMAAGIVGVAVVGTLLYVYFRPVKTAYLEGKAKGGDKKPADAKAAPAAAAAAPAAASSSSSIPAGTLDAKEFAPLKLLEIRPYNHNTKQYVFELATPTTKLNLPTASFVLVKSANKTEDGKDVIRPYTPIDQHLLGQLHLLVKHYPGGLLTSYLGGLKVGDMVQFKGPVKKIEYKANMKKTIGMIAGGTGITPMLQVIDEILSNPNDKTRLSLLFANDTKEDILLRERLDELKARYGEQLKVNYVLLKPPTDWKGEKGYVTEDLIKKYMPAPGPDSLVMVCGPPPMMKALSGDKVKNTTTGAMEQGPLSGTLLTLKYTSDSVFKF